MLSVLASRLKVRKGLVKANHEQAWEEFILPVKSEAATVLTNKGTVTTSEDESSRVVMGDNFKLVIDKTSGIISSYQIQGREFMKQGPKLNFFRPPTEIDIRDRNGNRKWTAAGLDRLVAKADNMEVKPQEDGSLILVIPVSMTSDAQNIPAVMQYQIFGDGTFNVTSEVIIPKAVAAVAKVGFAD